MGLINNHEHTCTQNRLGIKNTTRFLINRQKLRSTRFKSIRIMLTNHNQCVSRWRVLPNFTVVRIASHIFQ